VEPAAAMINAIESVRTRLRAVLAGRPLEPLVVSARRADYERRRAVRRIRTGRTPRVDPTLESALADLRRDGFVVVPGHTPLSVVARLREEFEACLTTPSALEAVQDDAARAARGQDRPGPGLDAEEIVAGPEHYRLRTNTVSVAEPLLRCPTALELAFEPTMLALASAYLRCPAAITGVDLRRSFVNDVPGIGDLYKFHSDANSVRLVKCFTYLNDVDEDGGPLLYVRGSHRHRPPGWTGKYLWTRDEMMAQYGADQVVAVTGHSGDVIIADTSGFHTGSKPRTHDRTVLVVNHVVHKELDGRHPWLQVRTEAFERLDPAQQRAADLLRVVPIGSRPSPA
jgi:Phytanoyl-CoA dioxygenase (PhyH)